MTHHSIEELERQYSQAISQLRQAELARMAAFERLSDAKCADKMAKFEAMGGVVGVTKVRAKTGLWADEPDMSHGPYFVMGAIAGHGLTFYRLAKVKKNGTPSGAPCTVRCGGVIIVPEDNQ